MAFGDLKGTLKVGALSITTPVAATGSVSVSVGDLIVCEVAERAAAVTVTSVTDNLHTPTTYTAQNAGSAGTNATGRLFWKIATAAGTLTSVSAAMTNSTDDVAVVAAVFAGPFAASPLDATPANLTDDLASPFACPASGVLAQASELVIAAVALVRGQTNTAATSPNLLAVNQASAAANALVSICAAIGYQVVSATTSIAPAFTCASGTFTGTVLHTISFKALAAKSLVADVGSYTLTGTAATLRRNLPLVAGTASYALTGSAATLRRNLPLSAGAGVYALTGTAASPLHQWKLAGAAGSYALTGTAATLNRGQRFAADAGSYSLTGATAGLLHQWRASAGVGSYALTGTPATLTRNLPLAAASGSYSLTGTAASPLHNGRLVGGAGSYALTGTDAALTLTAQKILSAGAAAYSLTGATAALLRQQRFPAGAGAYLLTGANAGLTIGTPGAGGSSDAITGFMANVNRLMLRG